MNNLRLIKTGFPLQTFRLASPLRVLAWRPRFTSPLHVPTSYFLLPTPYFLLLIIILTFAIFFSALAIQQHRTFQTNGLDLGNVDQALWNTAQGRFLDFTLMTPIRSRLALHVEPILLLLTPFYWLGLGSPELLLIIQATVVAFGAWPLYQIAIHNFNLRDSSYREGEDNGGDAPHAPRPFGQFFCLIFPLAYLLLPTLESAVLFDFHAVTLAPTFLLFAFEAIEQKNNAKFLNLRNSPRRGGEGNEGDPPHAPRPFGQIFDLLRRSKFLLFVLLAMACKEDMPLVVAMLGLYLGLTRRGWRLAALTIGLSLIWFSVAFFIIQPSFAASGNIQLGRYAWLGDSPTMMLKTLFTQPVLVFDHLWDRADLPNYLITLFSPTAFLALLDPLALLPMLPTLAVNLLSDNPFTWRLEDFHYGAPLAPFLFISTIYGLRSLLHFILIFLKNLLAASPPRPPRGGRNSNSPLWGGRGEYYVYSSLFTLLLAFTLIYHYHRGFTPLARPFEWPEVTTHHRRLAEIMSTIPADAPLFTQSNLAPHLTHRPVIYTDFAYFTDPAFPAPVKADEILLDITGFENIGGLHQFLRRQLLESGDYRIVTAEDGILYLQKAASQPLTAVPRPSFYTFTRPDSPPQYQLTVDFGDILRLHGYSLYFNRQEEVQVEVDLEPLLPLASTPAIQPVLYLLDAEGQPTGGTPDLQPALVWFPPSAWPVGETTRVRFNTLPWYTRDGADAYRLALGLINGSDIWRSPKYRPTLTQPTPYAVRLPADGDLVELAHIQQIWAIPEGGPLLRQFAPPTPPYTLQANFDNQLQLLGYSTSPSNPLREPSNLARRTSLGEPSTPPILTLYWQALAAPDNLTRFVQLIGPDGKIYGQNDSAPDWGQYPTSLWLPGEVVIETVSLPFQTDLPAGKYTFHIGLYHPDTGKRLPLTTGGDHIEIELPDIFP